MAVTERGKNLLPVICLHTWCRTLFMWIGLILLALAMASCSKQGNSETPASQAPGGTAPAATETGSSAAKVTPQTRDQASKTFADRCAACHGSDGRGDGPGAANLNPKPRDFHDHAWQSSVNDSQIETVIVYGGTAVGKSALMVGNPDLANQPVVVSSLREMIRKMGTEK